MPGGGGGFGTGVQGQWGNNSAPPANRPASMGGSSTGTSSGVYEARVVSELCAAGGARVQPAPATLQEFCRKCESLDANAVGDQLRQKLTGTDWQTRLKALYAIEALASH